MAQRRWALSDFPELKIANFALLLSVRQTENRINDKQRNGVELNFVRSVELCQKSQEVQFFTDFVGIKSKKC